MRHTVQSASIGKLPLRRERFDAQRLFRGTSQHSAWADRRLFQACGSLSAADYLRERASTFGSLHAPLNQILVADRIWIARLEGRTSPPLDENRILYPDLIGLKSPALPRTSGSAPIGGLSEAMLGRPLQYQNRRGDYYATPIRFALAHLFDHHAGCRGAPLASLAQSGVRRLPSTCSPFCAKREPHSWLAGFPRFAANFMERS